MTGLPMTGPPWTVVRRLWTEVQVTDELQVLCLIV